VNQIFWGVQPQGSTNLASVLKAALNDHFKTGNDETILIITDGKPDSEKHVKDVIVEATHKITRLGELSISFIQIGNDRGATEFLEELDDDLKGAKMDIVDCVTTSNIGTMTFSQLIQKSLLD